MKKIFSVLFVFVFLGFAQMVGAEKKSVNTNFEYAVSADSSGNVILSFIPETEGIAGDGYVIEYEDIDGYSDYYFLPEGDPLVLPNNAYFYLYVARGYQHSEEIISGEFKVIQVNLQEKGINVGHLEIAKLEKTISFICNVEIIANYKKGNLQVLTDTYISIFIHYDWIDTEFYAHGRGGYQPPKEKHKKINVDSGFVNFPKSKDYTHFYATPVIEDNANNRLIKNTAGESFNFQR
jgi:hypothetical protein